ncbi:MAG: hypothetical protein AB7I41_06100 [Candidatus Sericytochromatia bacterium]
MSFSSHIRKNAKPFNWASLHSSQQQAALQLFHMLNAFCLEANNSKSDEVIAGIQENRSANILFLDGKRGSGKSSILFSLIRATQNEEFKKQFLNQDISQELNTLLDSLQDQIVWLNVLDLELLPEPTNLLAAILVRIEAAFKMVLKDPCQGSSSKTILTASHCEDPWQAFSNLLTHVSVGWNTDLLNRRNTDIDTHSSELLRVERSRLEFRNFNQILTGLAKYYKQLKESCKLPLFVLPIDDADLNPLRYLELFQLIRLIPSRHLVFLVAGKYDNLETLFKLSYVHELKQLANGLSYHPQSVFHHPIEEFATQLGYAAQRKIIPSGGHLIQLKDLSRQEGASFIPPELTSDRSQKTLQTLMESIKLPTETEEKDYLKPFQNFWGLISLNAEQAHEWSQTSEIFAGPIRSIYDMWQEFSKLSPQNPEQEFSWEHFLKLIEFIQSGFEASLSSEPALPIDFRERIRTIFESNGGIPSLDNKNKDIVVLPAELTKYIERKQENTHKENPYKFRSVSPLKVYWESKENKKILLDNWRSGWLFLNHDLNLIKPGNNISRLNFDKASRFWASSHIFSREEHELLNWPMPDWFAFSHLEQFRVYWNLALIEIKKINELTSEISNTDNQPITTLDFAAYCWCKGILEVILGIKPTLINATEYLQNPINKWEVNATHLGQSIFSYQNRHSYVSDLRRDYIWNWSVQLAEILAPECGLNMKISNCFIPFFGNRREEINQSGDVASRNGNSIYWHRFATEIIDRRAKRLINFDEKNPDSSIEKALRTIELWIIPYSNDSSLDLVNRNFFGHPVQDFGSEVEKPLSFKKVLLRALEILQPYINPSSEIYFNNLSQAINNLEDHLHEETH